MNLVVDYGNTRIKVGIFDSYTLKEKRAFEEEGMVTRFLKDRLFDHAMVALAKDSYVDFLSQLPVRGTKKEIKNSVSMPFHMQYVTPHTLGSDRIASVCGAVKRIPKNHCLIIDMGTCIKFDFVDADRNYFGGSISPGVQMRFRAMYTFIPALPYVALDDQVPLIGRETKECMQSGVLNGVLAEIDGIINRYKNTYPGLQVILSGGDVVFVKKKTTHAVLVYPDLVLEGLNNVLLNNV